LGELSLRTADNLHHVRAVSFIPVRKNEDLERNIKEGKHSVSMVVFRGIENCLL